MGNNFFRFRQFTVSQDKAVFKVGTDGVLLGAIADMPDTGRILDIGTGTGLIALMAAQRTGCSILAIEPDHNSFLQAKENIKAAKWAGRISVRECTFEKYFQENTDLFDLIISNPPYFRNSLKNQDPSKTMTRHADSLTALQILMGSVKLLSENGSLEVIMPYTEGTVFIAEAAEWGLFCNRIIKVRGTPGGEIKRLIMKFERAKKPLYEKFITIETGIRHQYTKEYQEVTKDFYLDDRF